MKLKLVILSLAISASALSQFGNEWINYNQQYYKMPIAQDGIYRIGYNTLVNAGVPVASIPSSEYQIIGRDEIIPIRVVDGGNAVLDAGDYIEFYAQGNDGWLDSLVYKDPNSIGNPEYSLYNDTVMYFLSWGTSNAERMVEYSNTNFGSFSSSPYFWKRTFVNHSSHYYQGELWFGTSSSYFIPGEGWFSQQKKRLWFNK